jgi:hypothetical protein
MRLAVIAIAVFVVVALVILSRTSPHAPVQQGMGDVGQGTVLDQSYSSNIYKFAVNMPEGYQVNEAYQDSTLGPGKEIHGVAFSIPQTMASGTNLASDSDVSVLVLPNAAQCDAAQFLFTGAHQSSLTDAGTTYSFGTVSDAGAGNRYEESVYALPNSSPCTAVRYFIHYSVIENYPPGAVKEFDKQALLAQFDAIRHSLTFTR